MAFKMSLPLQALINNLSLSSLFFIGCEGVGCADTALECFHIWSPMHTLLRTSNTSYSCALFIICDSQTFVCDSASVCVCLHVLDVDATHVLTRYVTHTDTHTYNLHIDSTHRTHNI